MLNKHKKSISSVSTLDSNGITNAQCNLKILSRAISHQIKQFYNIKKNEIFTFKKNTDSQKKFNMNKKKIFKIEKFFEKNETLKTIEDSNFWLHLLNKIKEVIPECHSPTRKFQSSYILFKRLISQLRTKKKEFEPKNMLFFYLACFSLTVKFLEDNVTYNKILSDLCYLSCSKLLEYELMVFLEFLHGEATVSFSDLKYEMQVLTMLFC